MRLLKRLIRQLLDCEYPYEDGDVLILGPGVIANKYGDVINWRGSHFERKA